MHTARSAPATAAEIKARVRDEINALAERGQPNLFGLLERGAENIGWAQYPINAELTGLNPLMAPDKSTTHATGIATDDIPDGLALTVWLHKDALLERLESEIDLISDDANALTQEQRAEREASILAAILDVERSECWHIEQAASQGTDMPLRPDMDVRAFLCVEGAPLTGY